jgi:hypothetical protein
MTPKKSKTAKVYTAPHRPRLRYRAPWHRAVGFAALIVGLGVVTANLMTEFTETKLLPGGHSPLYLVAGVAIASYSMWWFGWFDRQG